MKIYTYSKKGIGKKACEDAALVKGKIISNSYFEIQEEEKMIVAIADGVGGNAGGDYASQFVLEKLKNITVSSISTDYLKQIFLDINQDLLSYACNHSGKEKMATTLTGLIKNLDNYFLFHIGNTRMYGLQGSYLKQLTIDQTSYQWLMNRGEIEFAEKCNKNEITNCMGGGNLQYGNSVVIKEMDSLNLYKRILFTTDGVHDYVSIDDLEAFVSENITETTILELLNLASNKGSLDDQTIIVIDRM